MRHVNGVALTPVGKAFVRRATAIQFELERTKDEIQQLKGMKTGSVAVGLSTAAHVALLPRVLRSFSRSFPDVQLTIVEGLFPAMEADLYDGLIDFYVGPLAEASVSSEFAIEKLFDNRRIVVGRRNHPLAHARSLAELADAKWVTTSVTVSSDAELGPVFARFKLPAPLVVVKVQTGLSLILVAANSDFLAMLPRQWMNFIKSTKLLHHFDVREELVSPSICVVRRARLPLTPVAEHLCDLFRRAATHHTAVAQP